VNPHRKKKVFRYNSGPVHTKCIRPTPSSDSRFFTGFPDFFGMKKE